MAGKICLTTSYQIKEGETTGEAIQRIVRNQIDRALNEMAGAKQDTDSAIHDARVCFKKIRAALKLAREQLGGTYDKENLFYRDLGRKLSVVRNNTAIIETVDKLRRHFAGNISPAVFNDLRKPFVRANSKQQAEKKKALMEVARPLRTARSRIKEWPLRKNDFVLLAEGLQLTYKRGRAAFWTAQQSPTVENLHEWRKATKALWYEVRILIPLWPDLIAKFAEEIEALGDFLSDDHDLALVRQRISEYSKIEVPNRSAILVALVEERRLELQFQAMFLGGRIYAEKPRQFAARFTRYWKAWREELESQPKELNAASKANLPRRAA